MVVCRTSIVLNRFVLPRPGQKSIQVKGAVKSSFVGFRGLENGVKYIDSTDQSEDVVRSRKGVNWRNNVQSSRSNSLMRGHGFVESPAKALPDRTKK